MKALAYTRDILRALRQGATLVVSISGGKDSQALLNALVRDKKRYQWTGTIVAVHATLGRAEWRQTLPHCRHICAQAGIPLVVVRRRDGRDLVDQWKQRMHDLAGTGKPFWSSSKARYCTSALKREPLNKFLRTFTGSVISAEGIRAAESRTRAKKTIAEVRQQITTKARKAYTWRPLLHWSTEDVWNACGTTTADLERRQALYKAGQVEAAFDGWPAHVAYVIGNQRVSCALCVLASKNDLKNGAVHHPDLYIELVSMETESGVSFRQDLALSTLFEPEVPKEIKPRKRRKNQVVIAA